MEFKRGDVILIDLLPTVGSVQSGKRFGLVIQNDVGNKYSTTIIVGLLTTKIKDLPTHVFIESDNVNKLKEDSMFMGEQLITIDKTQICKNIGNVSSKIMDKIDNAICISLAIK